MSAEDRLHAALGGSTSNIWSNCPGSFFYKKDLPPQLPTKYTDEGTKAHEIAEIMLEDFLANKVEGMDPYFRSEQLRASYDEAMFEGAQGYVQDLWEKALEGSITGKFYGLEDKFCLSQEFDMWGYTDFWAVHLDDRAKRRGIVVDYKYGYTKVSIDKNSQLAFYACAMQEEFAAKGKELDYITAVIYQPRTEGESYKETTFTNSQLKTWKKKFLKAGAQIFIKQKAKFKVGDHCRWCQAQAICKAYARNVIDSSEMAIVDTKVELPTPEKLDDKALSNIILNADKLEQFLDSCKKYGISRFIKGNAIPGTKCVASKPRRTWKKGEDTAIADRLVAVGIDNPYAEPKLRGITEIQKELSKMVGKEDAEQLVSINCQKTNPTISLVSLDDPRPAVATTEDFLTEITE